MRQPPAGICRPSYPVAPRVTRPNWCWGGPVVRCESCKDELLVAFSCKGRGVCPSCNAKRAHVTAVHLVERVLPHVPDGPGGVRAILDALLGPSSPARLPSLGPPCVLSSTCWWGMLSVSRLLSTKRA
ncbi:transposase zinc-binding domain-containing protein [Vitiosangium sp. GDMCC 1.1324]|uniref:transposase zinc-binding domain-containing protein n=1 Tax=Vitiosangium sp. (strain GDMCC 1.1324) TaxID=2138576 RepID=UPI000D364BBB|nr:hypothetical protein DAT35_48840 [Vitiosangium sp. GDMCC 1.1324]